MAELYKVDSPITREQRNNLNATFEDILRRLTNLRYQISILSGGKDLEDVIQRIEDAITAAGDAADNTQEKIDEVEAALTQLDGLIQDSNAATQGANDAATAARNEITNMQTLVNRLGNAESYDNAKTYYKNNIVEYNGSSFIALQDTTGNVPPTLPTKRNAYWQLLAQRGVDGAGSVSSVAGIGPNVNGNVDLTATSIGAASLQDVTDLRNEMDVVEKKVYGLVEARQFGAVGDGVADDTAAIQAMLDSNYTAVSFLNGLYRVTDKLVTNLEGRTISSNGAKLLADTQDMTVLEVNGANNKISIDIDGNGKGAIGIDVTSGGCEIYGCHIDNLHGEIVGVSGVRATTSLGIAIYDNFISNLTAMSNSTLGDNIGSARAILLTSKVAATEPSIVKGNVINNVLGEEGDAIQLLFYDDVSNNKFLSGLTMIENNNIKNANRRAIKIQASDVEVISNKHSNTLTASELANGAFLIDIINSDNVRVTNNTLDARLIKALQVSGVEGYRCDNVFVKSNNIYASPSFALNGIYLNQVSNSDISNNNIHGGSPAITMQLCDMLNIQSNVFFGNDVSKVAINIISNCNNIIVRDNIAAGERLYVVQNNAPNCIVENNHNANNVGGCIRTFATAIGSIYRNNTNNSSSQTVIGDFGDQYMCGSLNRGTGLSGVPNIMYTTDIPSTVMPNRKHNRGDIAFKINATAATSAGWICTTAGTGAAAVWKTLPNLSS